MSARDDGGQAFPSEFYETEHGDRVQAFAGSPGMTLRDWFAGQVVAAYATTVVSAHPETLAKSAASEGYKGTYDGYIALRAYKVADAMIAERSK